MKHLLVHIKGKVVCLWDNGPAHKGDVIKNFVLENKDRLAIFRIPAYSPEYNADEGVWDRMKYVDMGNYCPHDMNDLKKEIRKSIMRLRSKPHLIKTFFQNLPYQL